MIQYCRVSSYWVPLDLWMACTWGCRFLSSLSWLNWWQPASCKFGGTSEQLEQHDVIEVRSIFFRTLPPLCRRACVSWCRNIPSGWFFLFNKKLSCSKLERLTSIVLSLSYRVRGFTSNLRKFITCHAWYAILNLNKYIALKINVELLLLHRHSSQHTCFTTAFWARNDVAIRWEKHTRHHVREKIRLWIRLGDVTKPQ